MTFYSLTILNLIYNELNTSWTRLSTVYILVATIINYASLLQNLKPIKNIYNLTVAKLDWPRLMYVCRAGHGDMSNTALQRACDFKKWTDILYYQSNKIS